MYDKIIVEDLKNQNMQRKARAVIAQVKRVDPEVLLVGFKAEYNVSEEELIDRSLRRLREMGMDLIVANDVSREKRGFGVDTNEVYIVDPSMSVLHITLTTKKEIATKLLDKIKSQLK